MLGSVKEGRSVKVGVNVQVNVNGDLKMGRWNTGGKCEKMDLEMQIVTSSPQTCKMNGMPTSESKKPKMKTIPATQERCTGE